MDGSRFDNLARSLASGRSRRGFLKSLTGAALGAVGLGLADAVAQTCLAEGAVCAKGGDCCSGICNGAASKGKPKTCAACKPKKNCPAGVCSSAYSDGCGGTINCSNNCTGCQSCSGSGVCVDDASKCDDGNACTVNSCVSGVCSFSTPVDCSTPPNACMLPGSCIPGTGQCSYPPVAAGTSCGDCQRCDGNGLCVTRTPTCEPGDCGEKVDSNCSLVSAFCFGCPSCYTCSGTINGTCQPSPAGTTCPTGVCNGSGACGCVTDTDCGDCQACGPDGTCIPNFPTCEPGDCGIKTVSNCSVGSLCLCEECQICSNGTCQQAPAGTECEAGVCDASGTCGAACAPGLTDCGGVCTDTMTNWVSCGACGVICAVNQICRNGQCVTPECKFDQDCGAGRVCSNGTCVCAPGFSLCGFSCLNTSSDILHCGSCTHTCGIDETCVDGVCQGPCDCEIDGVCYREGDGRPGNLCEFCSPARNATAWSPRCPFSGTQCSSFECNPTNGTCYDRPVNEGKVCSTAIVGDQCRSFASGTCQEGICQGLVEVGAACQITAPLSVLCNPTGAGVCAEDGSCVAQTVSRICGSDECSQTLCDNGYCTKKVPKNNNGTVCTVDANTAGKCVYLLDDFSICLDGECWSWPIEDGEPCNDVRYGECSPRFCQSGQCVDNVLAICPLREECTPEQYGICNTDGSCSYGGTPRGNGQIACVPGSASIESVPCCPGQECIALSTQIDFLSWGCFNPGDTRPVGI